MPTPTPLGARYLAALLSLLAMSASAPTADAARIASVVPVDREIVLVHIQDGEAVFTDDGKRSSAFKGHAFADGDDRMVSFGEGLDTAAATVPGNWTLTSADDASYARPTHPASISRKAKVLNTTHDWQFKLDHWLFLRLPSALRQGASYELTAAAPTRADTAPVRFTFDVLSHQSEAVHVNLIGYPASAPVKAADLYLWLGDGGARDYTSFVGNKVWLVDAASGARHDVGQVRFGAKAAREHQNRNLTGSDVWHVDFSSFDKPGRYRLAVDGVGASAPFEIRADVYFEPFRFSVRGFYYMRIGEPVDAASPPPRQPRFIHGKDPTPGFTIYLTDLHPWDQGWKGHGDTWDEPHFKKPTDSIFWKRRLPGNPTNPKALGGHSDAADWDRHLGHVSIIYDMLLPYVLSGGKLKDDNLGIRESGNGIPDLLDEARNEVDLWLSLRDGEAYSHGLTNPSNDHTVMFQAGCTAMAAWANAANCAMMAEAFRLSGHTDLRDLYRREAETAYAFASRQKDTMLDQVQNVGDSSLRGRDFRSIAAAFLFNVTGDRKWEQALAADAAITFPTNEVIKENAWDLTWTIAAYLSTPHRRGNEDLARQMAAAVRAEAQAKHFGPAASRPSRRTARDLWWQTSQNLHAVILLHRFTSDAAERDKALRALLLEADWGLGRNPSNIVEMTGLGSRHIVNAYTSGQNDGVPGVHPGHTPYNNIEPWGGNHNGSNPRWFTTRGYPDWDTGGWPYQEGIFNSRYTWAHSEFTPQQTMRGKMALYGYLLAVSR